MNLLTTEKLSKSYTDKVLLQDITFGINEGDKIGVIGINGTGKSTFLKLLAGIEQPDAGKITKGNKIRVEYLPQNPVFDESMSILENVIAGKTAQEAHWNLEGEAKAMLEKVGITRVDDVASTLSGGQRKRAALIRTLLTPADILVLDEPTNHLDNEMAEWLEAYLNKWQGAFIMVTHDRYFLDKVTNQIVEIDDGKVYSYQTNYTGFLELKAAREEQVLATERKKKSLYKQDLEWMMRGARARSTKQKAHIQRFEELRDREKPKEKVSVEVNTLSSRLGKKTIEVNNVGAWYGDHVLIKDFSYLFLHQDRIGIVGHNGCGKTTLLNMITGARKPDAGEVVVGETVKIGYFSQENEYMDENEKVLDYIRDTAEYIKTESGMATASQMCERFLFNGTLQHSRIEKLSGGEKRRLYLLKVLMEAPNILILDEPTNDLDIQTLSILEDYLMGYDGIVITVSHDRYFLDRLVTRIFAFEGNGMIVQYEGNYTDYREKTKGQSPTIGQEVKKDKSSKEGWKTGRENQVRFSYQEKKEYDVIDEVIQDIEEKLASIEEDIEASAQSYTRLSELMEQKSKLEQQLEEKMERWVYLNELNEKIQEQKNQ